MTRRITAPIAATALVSAAILAGCGSSSSNSTSSGATAPSGGAKTLTGAGSTLVYPLVSQWQPDYQKRAGVTINYGAVGSGAGIAQITARTVDFGASDAPLTADQATAAKGVVQIPWALAATLVAYNVKGVPNHLKLTGPVIADMFLGKVTRWNDPAIARLNPGVALPATAVTPVYRSDGSGDTYAFTDYLSRVSPSWKTRVGTSTQVSFPKGVAGKGNAGVGGLISTTDGSVGYVAVSYVFENSFDYALVRNAAGRYPVPGLASIAAAARAVTRVPADNRVSIVDPPSSAPDAYPISTFTYALVPKRSPKATTLRPFLAYAIGAGQRFGAQLTFAPLPPAVLAADRRTIASIQAG